MNRPAAELWKYILQNPVCNSTPAISSTALLPARTVLSINIEQDCAWKLSISRILPTSPIFHLRLLNPAKHTRQQQLISSKPNKKPKTGTFESPATAGDFFCALLLPPKLAWGLNNWLCLALFFRRPNAHIFSYYVVFKELTPNYLF
jgi:hypothetical protein